MVSDVVPTFILLNIVREVKKNDDSFLYACEVKSYTNNEMIKLNTAVNDAIRKIFSFSRRESTREIRMRYGHDSISEIFHKRSDCFLQKVPRLRNKTLDSLMAILNEC